MSTSPASVSYDSDHDANDERLILFELTMVDIKIRSLGHQAKSLHPKSQKQMLKEPGKNHLSSQGYSVRNLLSYKCLIDIISTRSNPYFNPSAVRGHILPPRLSNCMAVEQFPGGSEI